MKIDIWSDVVCPWCYIGKRHLEAALGEFAHRDDVEVEWHAFELDPAAPRVREGNYIDRLSRKYGVAPSDAQAMIDRMSNTAAEAGLRFRFDIARPGNTFDAHRLIAMAGEHGVQDAVKERLLAGYMTEGEAIGEADTLVRLVAEAGLDADEARAVLATDAYTQQVRDDEAAAAGMGVSGVPFFVFDRRLAVSGAQPAALLERVLERAWDERAAVQVVAGEAGAACDDDTCAI